MNGSRFPIRVLTTAILLVSVSFPAFSQDARPPSGLPAYIKTPADRPSFEGIEPEIVGPNRTSESVLAAISPKDSVIVINGKVNMGGAAYFSAHPKFRAGSLYGAMKACEKEYLMIPQYKATENEGYTFLVVIKDTAENTDCWYQFRNLGTVDLSCDQIMVKPAEKSEIVVWNNPDSVYVNNYDLRTFDLGPVTPR